MTIDQKLMLTGSVLILTIITGVVLSKFGKPYNKLVFNIHKLTALAVFVYSVIIAIQIFNCEVSTYFMLTVVSVVILFSAAAFITGGMLSVKTDGKAIVLTIHRVASFILFAGGFAMLILPLIN